MYIVQIFSKMLLFIVFFESLKNTLIVLIYLHQHKN